MRRRQASPGLRPPAAQAWSCRDLACAPGVRAPQRRAQTEPWAALTCPSLEQASTRVRPATLPEPAPQRAVRGASFRCRDQACSGVTGYQATITWYYKRQATIYCSSSVAAHGFRSPVTCLCMQVPRLGAAPSPGWQPGGQARIGADALRHCDVAPDRAHRTPGGLRSPRGGEPPRAAERCEAGHRARGAALSARGACGALPRALPRGGGEAGRAAAAGRAGCSATHGRTWA